MKTIFNALKQQPGWVMLVNFAILMVVYMLMRWIFYYVYADTFSEVSLRDMLTISWGGMRFDASALCYLNALCVLLQFVPLKARHTVRYQRVVKAIFLVVNVLGVAVGMADIAYFEFGGRRTTATIFQEFGGEGNLGTILAHSVINYWYVWLLGLALVAAIIGLYYNPIKHDRSADSYPAPRVYYPVHTVVFVLAVVLTVGGMRGGLGMKMHPLRQDSADIYCKRPLEAAIVLNTPFTLITTLHKKGYVDPKFFAPEQLDAIFNPIKNQQPRGGEMRRYNVVVFLLESFSMEYMGYFNHDKDGGRYQGYTPFLDSLLTQSYCFRYGFANGIRSVDCMPASFAGIPRYINPYCYFVYSNNTLQGLPEMLHEQGYVTAFFHGAPNNTLGFKGFTNSIGFETYYGMDEYDNDDDFDGTWAIFDEPYLKYFAEKSDEIAQQGKPMFLTVFTASSHDPFKVPEQYEKTFTRGEIPMHRVISYADHAIAQYFEQVKDKPWFNNTIFVFTADHCGVSYRDDYNNNMGRFLIPIFFYTPGGQLPVKCDSTRLIQQADITPTLLGLLNYPKPYFSFGKDVFNPAEPNYVFNDRNGTSMYYLDSLMIEYNQNRLIGIYNFRNDFSLKHNLLKQSEKFDQVPMMRRQLEAIIQQYVTRMRDNRLTAP